MRHLLLGLVLAGLGSLMRLGMGAANPQAANRIPSRRPSRRFRRLTSILD